MKKSLFCLVVLWGASLALAAEPTPVAHWSFDGDKPEIGQIEGSVVLGQDGPSAKQFTSFAADNRAALFGGEKAGFIRVKDSGKASMFDFDNGDAITIEAWVNPAAVPKGGNVYILGKGRTSNPGVAKDNQNYGLRLWEGGGFLRLSFLFRSRKDGDHAGDWHRWTTTGGFGAASGWHHVAVSYVFGKPETMRGYIDGEDVTGKWDMGGATTQAPVVDDDEVWLGTSMSKQASVSFDGLMDEVKLYREVLPEKVIAARYPVVPYTPQLPEGGLPKDKVRVEIVEKLGKTGKWPRMFPEPSDVYEEDVFGFFQIAQKYTDSGVRAERSNPYLLRAMANITLPEGK
ncbi:LamG domain-containing protein, partial [Prosthecobacter sp.]|uniref:LamG domain-containing protein n=1 Tax=Prosthecobacter sp. TaxID=1965333 RepID=UPI001D53EA2A